ncbi:hypothetical protein L211DRAFT_766223, partial [Terfezia boudieri ATCC MYA-4762]
PRLACILTCHIGRFHMYAHEYKCRILYNTQRSEGWGHIVGEENETDWSLKTHLVAPTRVASGPCR